MQRKRTQVWMDSDLQKGFTKVVLQSTIVTAIFGSFAGFIVGALGAARAAGIQDPKIVFSWLIRSQALILLLPVIFLALLVSLLVWKSVRSSHKIAGPMVPIGRGLTRIREGDFSEPIRLRQDDWMHELVDDLNATFEVVRVRQVNMESRITELTQGSGSEVAEDAEREDSRPEPVTAGT